MTPILIVEDDHSNSALLQAIVEGLGYTTFIAEDAEQVFAYLGKNRPSAILMDLRIPGSLDGIALTHELRNSWHLRDVPIIAVTASDILPDQLRAAGFVGYHRKPVDFRALGAQLNAMLN